MKVIILFSLIWLCLFYESYGQKVNMGAGINVSQQDYINFLGIHDNHIWAIPFNFCPISVFENENHVKGVSTKHGKKLTVTSEDNLPVNIFALGENKAWILLLNIPDKTKEMILKTFY